LLERLIERDRLVLIAGLIIVIALSWVWLLLGAGMEMNAFQMTGQIAGKSNMAATTPGMDMAMQRAAWSVGYAALMFSMWWVMMIAMMLPSAAPMLLLFARINSKNKAKGAAAKTPVAPTGVFAVGYLIAWGGFSLVATGLQWGLERSGLLSNMLSTTNAWLGAGILIAAGLWQLTPLKAVCLRHCRSPLGFLMAQWRPGWGGGDADGIALRIVLSGVLLVSDGAAVFRWRHEPVLDRGSRGLRTDRKTGALRRTLRPCVGCCSDCLGRLFGGSGRLAGSRNSRNTRLSSSYLRRWVSNSPKPNNRYCRILVSRLRGNDELSNISFWLLVRASPRTAPISLCATISES
jgi:predicted metal-binding membrane protein